MKKRGRLRGGIRPVTHVSRLAVVLAAVPFLAFGAYDVHSQLPENVLSLPGENAAAPTLRKLAPQGWAFFTKSSRSSVVVPYGEGSNGEWESLDLGPHSAASNVFGADRGSRAQGVEVALLLDGVDTKQWAKCSSDVDRCLSKSEGAEPITVDNVSPQPTVCGDVVLIDQTPVPWSYRDIVDYDVRAQKALRMDITC